MKTFSIISLKQAVEARPRPAECLAELIGKGSVAGDALTIAEADYEAWRVKYAKRGLGDYVAAVAKPVARVIDAVAGTNLQNCGGCEQRQGALNKRFPA